MQYVVREQLTALRFGSLHSSQVALQTRKNKTKTEKEKTKQSENVVQRCFKTLKGNLKGRKHRGCHVTYFDTYYRGAYLRAGAGARVRFETRKLARALISALVAHFPQTQSKASWESGRERGRLAAHT